MKSQFRIVSLLFIAWLPTALSPESHAAPVDAERARTVAERFLGMTKAGGLRLVWNGEKTRGAEEHELHVFNADGGGFVVVAGDDSVSPILGYSRDGAFFHDNMPENLQFWMDMLQGYVRDNRELCSKTGKTLKAAGWDNPWPARHETVVRYETAKWSQDAPYNNLCPTVDGTRSLTGCVATAIAIIMRYHQWPASGHGELPSYSYTYAPGKGRTQPGHNLGTVYNWQVMPLQDIGRTSTSSQIKENIATLMFDVGVMGGMQYGPGGTSGTLSQGAWSLTQYMGYDKGMQMLNKEYFQNESWVAELKKGLNECGPILYGAANKDNEGHAFVIEGYDTEGMFYINWGWGGQSNGWFAFPEMNGFDRYSQAVTGIRKDTGNTPEAFLGIDSIKAERELSTAGVDFIMTATVVMNSGISEFDCTVAPAVIHSDSSFEVAGNSSHLGILKPGEFYPTLKFNCTIPSPVRPGDRLSLVYRAEGEDAQPWKPVRLNNSTGAQTIPIDGAENFDGLKIVYECSARTFSLDASSCPGITYSLLDASSKPLCSGKGSFSRTMTGGSYTLTLSMDGKTREIPLTF